MPSNPASPAFVVLHVADFPLQALVRASPELAEHPVALLENERKRATVIALTPAAAALGVACGLTAPQAQARCAELLVRTRQPALEAEASAALQAVGFTLSPLIEATAPGILTADISNLPIARREDTLVAALTQLTDLGLAATGGLARTPLLALYAARACLPPTASPLRLTEAVRPNPTPHASANQKSEIKNQKSYLAVSDERAFLAPLPLAVAAPPPELHTVLTGWGLRTLGDLTALRKADVVQRLGPAGLALWERAAGETTRPLHPIAPPRTFAASVDLEHPVETLEPLLFLLRRFIDRLTLELRAAGLVAAELALTLPLEDETQHQRSFRLPEPTADADVVFRTLQSHLETVHTDAAVVGVRLVFEPTRPLARQHGLFDTGLRDPHGFAETLARTVALVGSGRVGTPKLQDTHRPDGITLEAPAPIIPPAEPAPVLPPLGPTLRRFRPPLPARVELGEVTRGEISKAKGPNAKETPNSKDGNPTFAPCAASFFSEKAQTPASTCRSLLAGDSGAPTGQARTIAGQQAPTTAGGPASVGPTYVWTERLHGAIELRRGPWRGSGDWWQRDQQWEREEWDVAVTDGGLYRLVRTPTGWWVEGEYD